MYKSMGATDPSGKDSLDPRGLIGRIYIATYMYYIHVSAVGLMISKDFF